MKQTRPAGMIPIALLVFWANAAWANTTDHDLPSGSIDRLYFAGQWPAPCRSSFCSGSGLRPNSSLNPETIIAEQWTAFPSMALAGWSAFPASAQSEDAPVTDIQEATDPDEEPANVKQPGISDPGAPRYTTDLSDADLKRLWKEAPGSLGSISLGVTEAGRLINGQPFPDGPNWHVIDPRGSYGTQETINYVTKAINEVAALFKDTPPLNICHLSAQRGGHLSPHRSHQSGRDIDLTFYTVAGKPANRFLANYDFPRNWALLRALVINGDVQYILLDRQIQRRLYDYALSIGEDRAWLNSLFKAQDSLFKHVRRHRDHYHVRFFNPRAQELARRIQPYLAPEKPQSGLVAHRIKGGDSLGSIARRYHTSVAAIRRANRLQGNAIRAGRTILVPSANAYAVCPLTPQVIVPPRRLPTSTPPMFAHRLPNVSAAVSPTPSNSAVVPTAGQR